MLFRSPLMRACTRKHTPIRPRTARKTSSGINQRTPGQPERPDHRCMSRLVGHEQQQADQLARLLTQQGFQVGVFDSWPERVSAGA